MTTSPIGGSARRSAQAAPLWTTRPGARRYVTPEPTLPLGDPTGGADALLWRESVDGHLAHPRVHIDRNVDLRMSDGVIMRATVVRPADRTGRPVSTPYPAIININPYNRAVVDAIDTATHTPVIGPAVTRASKAMTGGAMDLTGGLLDGFGINRRLVRSGYVQVIVDVRGTGASHGVWQILGSREQQDSVEILGWAREQEWCDGNLGMGGWSYSAINSLQAAGHNPPGLKAVFAIEGSEDIVRDIYITGGLPSAFIPMWLSVVNALKWVPNPRTVLHDALHGNTLGWLLSRIASPATELTAVVAGVLTGRDPRIHDNPYFDVRDPQIDAITAPTFLFGGWHDLFGRSTPRIYRRLNLPAGQKQMLVTDGYHFDMGTGFGGRQSPPRIDVLQRAWYDRWLKGVDNGVDGYGPVTLMQQGGQWTSGSEFPRAGARTRRLYLTSAPSDTAPHARFDGRLDGLPGRRHARLDTRPDLRGAVSRDMTQVTAGLTKGFAAFDEAGTQERGALSFTTPPAAEPVQISGALNLRIAASGQGHEAIWTATVNDVAPDGTSTVLTGGALTATNRAVDSARSDYDDAGELLSAFHPLTEAAKLPVEPDVVYELDIDLVDTDALIDEGHRIRVDVYAGSFPRYLATVPDLIRTRLGRQSLVLDPDAPSYLTLRLIGDPGW
ncbi:CocE/NonD family hydrolase [Tsukamurella sp. 8F]|uniref:CocE/NonD family hydrolase n=1 Tax=unclassified Tsukamurella TaxID=2633480 RepID=UPI0023B8DFEE|nr:MULTISPECIES: CocE/NonD family hydrolase [unclassified Tsukamurella]MDF0530465.1 CocE/NonD family hydrolase [Tsukamurella sp. 8J]MDF0587714.1 CocE/NonD family hydrolase [Tsukamurella sp. 8F]